MVVGKFSHLIEDVPFVGGIGRRGGALIEGEQFLRIDNEAGFGGDFFAVADREHMHAGGFQVVDRFIGGVVLAERGDKRGFRAKAGEMAGNHRRTAEEISVLQWRERHRGAVRRDVGGVTILITVPNQIAHDNEGAIDDVVHDLNERVAADLISFADRARVFPAQGPCAGRSCR